jgi:hypothetical protein
MNEKEAKEQARLVARGVRALAIVGVCPAEPSEMIGVAGDLETQAEAGAIPFLAERNDGGVDYGYAASAWVIDLLQWLESDAVPEKYRERIRGLLQGYSVEAIRQLEEQRVPAPREERAAAPARREYAPVTSRNHAA